MAGICSTGARTAHIETSASDPACLPGPPVPELRWQTLLELFDNKAEVRGRLMERAEYHVDVTLDVSGMDDIVAVDLSTGTVTREGTQSTTVLPAVQIEGVIAGAGTRLIVGDGGRNVLAAGSGGSIIDGAGGADILVGGPGRDYFVYNALEESHPDGGYDSIYGFEAGKDRIVIRMDDPMRPNRGEGGDYPFLGRKPELSLVERGCGWWQLTINEDDEGRSDFLLMVETPALVASDIYLI